MSPPAKNDHTVSKYRTLNAMLLDQNACLEFMSFVVKFYFRDVKYMIFTELVFVSNDM